MKQLSGAIRLSATDLSNHLHCSHLTAVNLKELQGEATAPPFRAPHLVVLQERGYQHEQAYLDHLTRQNLQIADLRKIITEARAVTETRQAMQEGLDVIVQAALEDGLWFGRPDILRKVSKPSLLGDWSYEPYDCKLTRDTKAATILQLSHYADLLSSIQGHPPESIFVVPPSEEFLTEQYRTLDYAAYYRSVRARLDAAMANPIQTYPEPAAHCDVCRWWPDCNRQWRRDDHLALTAGISRLQRKQLLEWDTTTMEGLSRMHLPLSQRPRYGAKEGYARVREQARVQVTGRQQRAPIYEILPFEPGRGFLRLPEPSEGDIFFDLESDPFVGQHGREYLFGFVTKTDGYVARWALTASEEKAAFEWFVDFALTRRQQFPGLHIYHFGHKEPSTLKALMGRYATREDAIDEMLRGGVLIDLHSITKQALRASVETYSLKAFEDFHDFKRVIPLDEAKTAMRQVEHGLELDRPSQIDPAAKEHVQAYNADDCYSTESLRDWLERLRQAQIAAGHPLDRPAVADGAAPDGVAEQQQRVTQLFGQLTAGVPVEPKERTEEQAARWLLANLLDWHRREKKVAYWERYRLRDLDDEDLLDERKALAGLQHELTIAPTGRGKIPTDEYRFPPQEVGLKPGDELFHQDLKVGTVVSVDPLQGRLAIKKTGKSINEHPTSVFSFDNVRGEVLAESLFRIGTAIHEGGLKQSGDFRSASNLLLRNPPDLLPLAGEQILDTAKRYALHLDGAVLAIQGPPGAGKTYTGARMIVELIRSGKRVGITAGSHKVVRKLMEEVYDARQDLHLRCLHKVTDLSEQGLPNWLEETDSNERAVDAVTGHTHAVVAGTAWLWARPELAGSLDVLFVDEAGQLSLANALAVSPAAKSLVLLGDPQQLDQPLKGSHPDGADVSALEHLLGGAKTIPASRGLFLSQTHRLHPKICEFTSEAFYEGRLVSRDGLDNQRLEGHPWLGDAGLRYVPVSHQFNQNCSPEEVARIAELVEELLHPTVHWINDKQARRRLLQEDILIVAPYNAQVALLANRLPGFSIGTVDKFQGQEAPIVIYSLTTSAPQDAPRGMEFLYSLNRLNVATSRARGIAILVASPQLLEPECGSPRQMQLANALCRYVELAGGTDRVLSAR